MALTLMPALDTAAIEDVPLYNVNDVLMLVSSGPAIVSVSVIP